ncbi:amino acid ABC transporter permease [Leucobacter sp. M11]|uniref:amino acid ABC transporter permease n=1 Tax=Leucobacter sp. M11 TaxID=2993565 RepID=UPI002D7FBA79|nr:amino acid ABC transporter permease [Leucobacter sp. M11]MEB4615014.1 amino acid ABC transporter permease [Leucobacter sp. M11]
MDTEAIVQLFVSGFWGTVKLASWTFVFSMLLGTLLGIMRISPIPVLRGAAGAYVTIMRNTPSTLVLFFCAFGLPYLDVKFGDDTATRSFIYAVIGLSCYTAAFISEAIRSGFATIPIGQAEAARSIGLTFSQSVTLVILPQAIRAVVPPIANHVIAMVKNTSIASAFNNKELISAMRNAVEIRGDLVLTLLVATAGAYLILTLSLGWLASVLERKMAVKR